MVARQSARSGQFPLVGYAAHPAFQCLAADSSAATAEVQRALAAINADFNALKARGRRFSPAEIDDFFSRDIDRHFDRIKKSALKSIAGDALAADVLANALAGTRARLAQDLAVCSDKLSYRPRAASRAAKGVLAQLHDHGLAVAQIPPAALDAINHDLADHRADLERKRAQDPFRNCWASLPLRGKWWDIVCTQLQNTGAVAGACDYAQRNYQVNYCALALAHPQESWYRNCYEDVGLPTPKTTYMHVDEEHDMIKLLVYLSDVTKENGPFCFIRGSHLWQRSFAQFCFFKQLDAQFHASLANEDPRDCVYHRKQFKFRKFREHFMRLPAPLRGSSHFGDDLLDGSEQSDALLRQESTILSTEGNLMVFHGGMGIHRGGIVESGERWVLQVGIRSLPPLPLAKRAIGQARRIVGGGIRSIVGDRLTERLKKAIRWKAKVHSKTT